MVQESRQQDRELIFKQIPHIVRIDIWVYLPEHKKTRCKESDYVVCETKYIYLYGTCTLVFCHQDS